MTTSESAKPKRDLLAKPRTEGRKVADQISSASALIDLDYRAAMTVLNDRLWPYCHDMKKGVAHDFLELQLMNAKEDLKGLTSPWRYSWGPDHDRLMETNDASEAKRLIAAMEKHLTETVPDDATKAKDLRGHLIGLAALLDEVAHRSAEARK